MKYKSSITKIVYDLEFSGENKKRYTCPECSGLRRKNKSKDLEFYKSDNRAYCFHCEATFFEYKPFESVKQYVVPEWRNKTSLTDKAVKYFESRMISQSTLNKMKVFSDVEYMPQHEKETEVICFPYFANEKQINIKFRGAKKAFKLVSGAELNWYNFDVLRGCNEVIIVEGEIDALSWVEAGFDNVISVPAGANCKLEYLENSLPLFENIEKIYLATDVDTKGIELRDELIRRFGCEKCYMINLKQHKDSNEYLITNGAFELAELIKQAKPIPTKGIVNLNSLYSDIVDMYEHGVIGGLKININEIDKFITWELGRLAVVTGIPSSGKSEVVDLIVSRLNLIHGWKTAYFTPENYPLKYHYRKIHEKFSGKKFDKKQGDTDFDTTFDYISENFFYILDEEDMTVETVMKSASILVKQKGIKILVIDPYNKLEHQYNKNENETQYISRFLDVLTNFAKFNNVLIFLVAHPRKMQRSEVPTLYDINGSANFYNKTDYGFTVHRKPTENGTMSNEVEIYWQKIKFKNLGEQGVSNMMYNYINGRLEEITGGGVNDWLFESWFSAQQKKEVEAAIITGNYIEPNENFDCPF